MPQRITVLHKFSQCKNKIKQKGFQVENLLKIIHKKTY